jgi:hypothetical protein
MSARHLLEWLRQVTLAFTILKLIRWFWRSIRDARGFYKTLTRPGHFGQAHGLPNWLCKFLASRALIHTRGGSWYRGPNPELGKPGKGLLFNSLCKNSLNRNLLFEKSL